MFLLWEYTGHSGGTWRRSLNRWWLEMSLCSKVKLKGRKTWCFKCGKTGYLHVECGPPKTGALPLTTEKKRTKKKKETRQPEEEAEKAPEENNRQASASEVPPPVDNMEVISLVEECLMVTKRRTKWHLVCFTQSQHTTTAKKDENLLTEFKQNPTPLLTCPQQIGCSL